MIGKAIASIAEPRLDNNKKKVVEMAESNWIKSERMRIMQMILFE